MSTHDSPARKRRQAAKKRRQDRLWALRASEVTVTQMEMCPDDPGCVDESCTKWHRL